MYLYLPLEGINIQISVWRYGGDMEKVTQLQYTRAYALALAHFYEH